MLEKLAERSPAEHLVGAMTGLASHVWAQRCSSPMSTWVPVYFRPCRQPPDVPGVDHAAAGASGSGDAGCDALSKSIPHSARVTSISK